MTPDPSDQVRDLIGVIELDNVRYTELTARTDPSQEPFAEPRFGLRVQVEDMDQLALPDRIHLAFSMRVELCTAEGEARVVALAEYHVPTDHAGLLSETVTMEFANHVVVMTLIPYLREALSDLSLRVFDARVLMPMFKRGELWFNDPHPTSGSDQPSSG